MTQHHLIETSPCLSTVGSGKWKFRKLKYPKCLWQRLREELILYYFYPRERRSSQKVVETPEDWVASRSSCLPPPRERPRTAVWRREVKWGWGWGGGVGGDRGGGASVCNLTFSPLASLLHPKATLCCLCWTSRLLWSRWRTPQSPKNHQCWSPLIETPWRGSDLTNECIYM